jgi:hypothetical protein
MKEFKCNTCNHDFKSKHNLFRHYKNKSLCESNDDNYTKTHQIPPINGGENDKFICTDCKKSFTRQDALTRHIKDRCKVQKEQEKEKIEKEREEKEREREEREREQKEREREQKEREREEKERFDKEEKMNKEREEMLREREMIFRLLIEKDNKIEKLIEHNNEIIKIFEENSRKNDEIIRSLVKGRSKALNSHNTNTNNSNNTNTNTNSNNTNTNNSNNNTVNIQITQFGKEEFDIIDDKHFQKIVKDPRILGLKVPEEILKLIHFNPDYPQFNNFYVSDFNREKVMVHDGKTWNLGTLNYIKDALDHVVTYGKTKLEEYGEKKNISDEGKNRLRRIDDAIKKCDEDYIDELKEKANEVEHNKPILDKIEDCEEFVKKTKENIKNIAYNQGKAIKKAIKIN